MMTADATRGDNVRSKPEEKQDSNHDMWLLHEVVASLQMSAEEQHEEGVW